MTMPTVNMSVDFQSVKGTQSSLSFKSSGTHGDTVVARHSVSQVNLVLSRLAPLHLHRIPSGQTDGFEQVALNNAELTLGSLLPADTVSGSSVQAESDSVAGCDQYCLSAALLLLPAARLVGPVTVTTATVAHRSPMRPMAQPGSVNRATQAQDSTQ